MLHVVRLLRPFTETERAERADDVPDCVSATSTTAPGPSSSRATQWRNFADISNGRPLEEGLYASLLQRAEAGTAASSSVGTARKQIEKDVHRTFGSVPGLRVPQQEAQQSLRNVLLAFAENNPQVGYCQSMNFLAAVLLLVVDEESAFWCLTAIVERVMPGYFSVCMEMTLVDQGVLSDFLILEDPQLVTHLEHLCAEPSLVTTQWLLTCFVGSALPLNALLGVWDAFFRERCVATSPLVATASSSLSHLPW